MFAGLFDEDAARYDAKHPSEGRRFGGHRPAAPRSSTRLCGLSNLGATCYLNSLLQTLHFTPEFREALFCLGEEELGVCSEEEGKDNSLVRLIPIQLQKLFARLLLLNQQSAAVDALTTSFGWRNNEELQQHDVQELNRILFCAIESSLLGTSGERLIATLYHGTSVQQITCQQCSRVSEREEEFLDIQVALSGCASLEKALNDMYINTELLEGPNQYSCENCQKLVDAKRGCHLRKLPPILTFALLRFLYDFQKGERYKDISKFKFPLELDMSPYCEGLSNAHASYELFSVVIHSGSTHSGHYTAYIRDIDDIGTWTHPDDEPVQLQASPGSGKVDYIDFDSPTELLQALLRQLGGSAQIDKLCKTMQEQTGVSWNKRFKKQFGSINKFLKSCTEYFVVNDMKQVFLREDNDSEESRKASPSQNQDKDQNGKSRQEIPMEAADSQYQERDTECETSNTCASTIASTGDPGSEAISCEVSPLDVGEADIGLLELPMEVIADSDGAKMGGGSADKVDSSAASMEGTDPGSHDVAMEDPSVDVGGTKKTGSVRRAKDPKPPPPPGHRWFEFNDAHVTPSLAKSLEKMYQGKQSAYMLFYRRKSLQRPPEAHGNLVFGVPERFQMEVAAANAKLDEERMEYDVAVNTVKVNIHLASDYAFANGALQRLTDTEPQVVSIDRRKNVSELIAAMSEVIPDVFDVYGGAVTIHTARKLPAGMHLYNLVSNDDSDTTSIMDAGITDESHLFVWGGEEVGGEAIQVGTPCEPILLNVTHPSCEEEDEGTEVELTLGFPKNSTLGELRVSLARLLGVRSNQVTVSQVKLPDRTQRVQQPSIIVLSGGKDKLTLEELRLTDGDRLAAERDVKKGVKTLAHSVADKQSKMLSLIVEDRCSPLRDGSAMHPVFPLEVARDELVGSLRTVIISQLGLKEMEDSGRLRVDDESGGLGPPLHENQTLTEAGMGSGLRVIIEPGKAPLDSQLALRCTCLTTRAVECELVVEKMTSVGECCTRMVHALGLEGDQWHLRKTNWCAEAAEILDDETATLEQERLKSGDLLLVEEGKLPPKGFISLTVFLYSPDTTPPAEPGVLSWITESAKGFVSSPGNVVAMETESRSLAEAGVEPMQVEPDRGGVNSAAMKEIPLHLLSPSQFYPHVPGLLTEIGSVLLSREATVEDLKSTIMTLPALDEGFIPSPTYTRVRELLNGRPGRVFKQQNQTLRRQKLTSGSQVCFTVLRHEENLPVTSIVFNACMRVPGEKRYGPLTELIYDTAHSTTAQSLRAYIADCFELPSDRVSIAKHKLETLEWVRIQDSHQSGKKSKKGRTTRTVNIKTAPVSLKDGETIGVKDLIYDPEDKDDFSTLADEQGRLVLAAIQEEKRKKRKAKRDSDVLSGGGESKQRTRRQEVGITIFVPDYKSKLHSQQ